jgi:hypothetical protein
MNWGLLLFAAWLLYGVADSMFDLSNRWKCWRVGHWPEQIEDRCVCWRCGRTLTEEPHLSLVKKDDDE